MPAALHRNLYLIAAFLTLSHFTTLTQLLQAQDGAVRARAVVHLSFDEADGAAQDSAAAGSVKEVGQLINGASRVKSPFAGQKGKSALIVDATKKQFVQIPDSADLDRTGGFTLSCYYLHLGSPEDAGFQGLFAKRAEGNGTTNYGINFGAKQDLLQVYLNDGTGFKLAQFGVQQALGFRRPGYLTATYEVGDAPGADADQDKDDVLVRLFLNGQPLPPRQQPGNINVGNDTWILNVNAATLVNDVPFTIGSSTPTIEFATGVYDELSLFSQALTPEDALKLFQETAGPNASTAVLAETLPAQTPPPVITSLSIQGLQLGTTGTLIVTGTNLQPAPIVKLPIPGATHVVGPNSNANQVEIQITVPATAPVQHYPIRIQTGSGVSNALPLAVDGLIQIAANTSSPEKPLTLPLAVSGTLSGAQLVKTYFSGKAGQRLIADVESRRLGAAMTPVVEIKNASGTPLKIEWGHVEFRGDARVEAVLPRDGLYYVELHDLSYAAPGANPFRLKLGDLKLADAVLGGAALGTDSVFTVSGPGMEPDTKFEVKSALLNIVMPRIQPLPASWGIAAPAPNLLSNTGRAYVETPAAPGQLQTIDAKLTAGQSASVDIYGVLKQRKERDVFVIQVNPGQKLNLQASAVAVDSPLDPQLQVLKHPEGNILAAAENPGSREAGLEFTVPAGQTEIQLAIRDLRAKGGLNFRYRVRISLAGQPDFGLALSTDRIQIPQDGSAVVQLEINRAGGYNGSVKLSVLEDPAITVSPAEIPAGISKAWITLTRQAATLATDAIPGIRIMGESADPNVQIRRVATVPTDPRLIFLANDRTLLATGLTSALGTSLELATLPGSIYRGVDITLPLQLKVSDQAKAKTARLTLLSTEASRLNNPADANQGKKPLVDGGISQTIEATDATGAFKISVPTDIAEASIDFVIKAELVEHPFAQNVYATTYSKPFRLPVQNAAVIQLTANNLALKSATLGKLTGTIKRTAGFAGPVSVQILNLPAGTTAPPVTIPAGQETFELPVTPPAVTAAVDVPNVVFRVLSEGGKPLQADLPLPAKIAP